MFVENPGIVSFVFVFCFSTNIYHLNKIQKQMKEPLGFPQTYIISTKYKTQQQKKQSLGLYFIEMIYVCGKPRGFFHLLLCFVFCSDDICLWET
jgi:hypothetical protein